MSVHSRFSGILKIVRMDLIFVLAMVSASVVGFAKVFFLAWLLSPADLGLYLTCLGVGIFFGAFLSFGEIERTYTLYPSYVAKNDVSSVFTDAKWMIRRLSFRLCLVATVIVCLSFSLRASSNLIVEVLVVGVTAISSSLHGLLASIGRAIDAAKLLPFFNLVRVLVSLIAVFFAYFTGTNWLGIVAFESFCGLVLFFTLFKRSEVLFGAISNKPLAAISDRNSDRGRKVWLSVLLASLIPYGGRAAVLFLAGPATAGSFGVIMIIVQSGQMVAGALSQKLASVVIGQEVDSSKRVGFLKIFGIPIFLQFSLGLAVFVFSSVSFFVPDFKEFWVKFDIGAIHIFLAALQVMASIYLLFHFAIMAKEREEDLLRAALISLFFFFGGFAVVAWFGFGLAGYLAAALCADIAQTVFLLWRYLRLIRVSS